MLLFHKGGLFFLTTFNNWFICPCLEQTQTFTACTLVTFLLSILYPNLNLFLSSLSSSLSFSRRNCTKGHPRVSPIEGCSTASYELIAIMAWCPQIILVVFNLNTWWRQRHSKSRMIIIFLVLNAESHTFKVQLCLMVGHTYITFDAFNCSNKYTCICSLSSSL